VRFSGKCSLKNSLSEVQASGQVSTKGGDEENEANLAS